MIASPFKSAPTIAPTLERLAANSSASQHKTFDMCKRLWWFEKVCGIKQRSAQHFIIGTALHGVAERYITGQAGSWEGLFPAATATAPAWDKGLDEHESTWIRSMATKAVELGLWQARASLVVEFPVAFLTAPHHIDARGLPLLARANTYVNEEGVRKVAKLTALYDGRPLPSDWSVSPPYVGFIDVLGLDDTPPLVADHKTSKHRGYALTPAKLAEDLQVLSYAAVPLAIRPDATTVQLRHLVFLKKPGVPEPAYKVDATATLQTVLAKWEHIRSNGLSMALLREIAPKVENGNPYARANNWEKVKSAIEEGRAKEACSCYGGCRFRDLCFGRCSAEQLVRRMDSPDPMEALVKPGQLAPAGKPTNPFKSSSNAAGPGRTANPFRKSTPTAAAAPLAQERHMPFAKPAPIVPAPLAVYQDVYVLDPDDAAVQFRARISSMSEDKSMVMLAIYPNPDVTPEFHTLPQIYRIEVPKEAVLTMPHPLAKIRSYQEALVAGGVTDDLTWKAAAVAPSAGPATVPLDKPLKRDEPAGATANPFVKSVVTVTAPQPAVITPSSGGPAPVPGSGAAIQQAAAKASAVLHDSVRPAPPLPAGAPPWAAVVEPGTTLVVAQTEHPRWSKYAGKPAIVMESAPGDTEGSLYFTVEIDGLPQPDVNAWRFDAPGAAAAGPEEVVLTLQERAKTLIGQVASISLTTTGSVFNCILDDADANGITFLNKSKTAVWSEVKDVIRFTPHHVPGAPPSPEEKAAAKAAAKAEKAAAKEAEKAATAQTKVEGTDPAPQVNPAGALAAALDAIKGALDGGKVTRKVLEGVMPLLQSAMTHQDNLEAGAPVAPVTGGPSAGAMSLTKVAIDHAIATLTDARGKLG